MLRLALFVEGSYAPPPPRGTRPLDRIWNEDLGPALGLPKFDLVVPISKRHLVALDPRNPKMSGAGESLAQLMARWLRREPFDAAVVAWDLVPAWNPDEELCRWQETVDLHRFLADAGDLPAEWRARARQRADELAARATPGDRQGPVRLEEFAVLPLCMEPMFEGVLAKNEAAVLRAFGLRRRPSGWPRRGWGSATERSPDRNLIGPAVESMRTLTRASRPRITRQVRGGWERNKDGWGQALLSRLLADDQARGQVLKDPLSVRLREMLA